MSPVTDNKFVYSSPTIMENPYPRWKYHATEPPRQVRNAVEDEALGADWSDTYIVQPYPKMLYDAEGGHKVVANPEEEKAAGKGWSDKAPAPKHGHAAAAPEPEPDEHNKKTPPAKK